MLFIISYIMFNISYLFIVLILVFLIIFIIIVYMRSIIYLKYLVILVYIRGVVVFILYISCICWNKKNNYSWLFLVFFFVIYYVFDVGLTIKFRDVGEFLWIYLFFRIVFSFLVTIYSLNLYKNSGSLRF